MDAPSRTTYGMPFLLEDRTGRLAGSDFVDINDRLRLRLRCTARAPTHTAYDVCSVHDHATSAPLATLAFGPDGALGTVAVGARAPVPMGEYLRKAAPSASGGSPSPRCRVFVASDGQEYRWGWRAAKGQEWTCTDRNQQPVAAYTLKLAGEPDYMGSSGCMLTIDEAYPHLAAEMLASLTVMRHIAAHDL